MGLNFAFEEIPPATRGRSSADPAEISVAEMLKSNKGKSARVFEYEGDKSASKASTTAQQINAGRRAGFGEGFEARSRSKDGMSVVYVTYVGTD